MTLALPRERTLRWSLILCQLIVAYFLALKLWFDIAVTPMGDEAYYWMWGQHLSWSYLDHPPLDAWLQALVAAIFGWSNFSARLLTWFTTGVSLYVLWLWSARRLPDDRAGWFWPSAVAYLAMPAIYLMSAAAFHDHLLVALTLASIYFFYGFAEKVEDGRDGWRDLYLAALLLGLAVLTKYNGVLLGVAYAVWILIRPKLRPLLLDWRLWAAALLAIAMQAPVIYWNFTEGFASIQFHMAQRGIAWGHPQPSEVLGFLGSIAFSISPILFFSLFRLPFLKPKSQAGARTLSLSTTIFLTSSLAWAFIALYVEVYFHWDIVAYAALAPITLMLLGRRIPYWLHVAWGLMIITPGMLSYIVTPMSLFGMRDASAGAAFGWTTLGTEVQKQEQAHPDAFLAATRYTYASQLGFVLHDPNIAAFNALPSQIDFWWHPTDHQGQDAIILADHAFPIDNAKGKFASLEKLEDVPVTAQGQTVWTFELWLGKDFGHGPG
jgi:4-amino-4-deoxy-L-arabinose transferase-like glycosyltransferase